MNATNASTKSSPKNEKCSPLSLFKRQNATNAYCTQCRTQANAPWRDLRGHSSSQLTLGPHLPSSFTQITSKSLSDFSSTAKVEQIGSISSQLPLSPSIPVACGHFRAAPPTLTRATAADIRGLSPLLYHQRCRQGVPSAICTNTVTTKPPHGGEEFTSTGFSWCGGLLCNLWWIW